MRLRFSIRTELFAWFFVMFLVNLGGNPGLAGQPRSPFQTAQIRQPSTVEPPLGTPDNPAPVPVVPRDSQPQTPSPVPVVPNQPNQTPIFTQPGPAPQLPPVIENPPVILEEPPVVICPVEDPPFPIVTLRVRVAACAKIGQELKYCITVENKAPVNAYHVLVRNPLPNNATFVRANPRPSMTEPELQWEIGTLPGMCCKKIELVLQPTSTEDIKNCARVQFEHGQCVTTRFVGSSPGSGQGSNAGQTPGQGNDPNKPGGAGKKPGTNPGQKPGQNPGTKPKDKPGKDTIKPKPIEKGPPALELSVSGPVKSVVNKLVVYSITIKNTGGSPAGNVLIADILPKKIIFDDEAKNITKPGVFSDDQVAWLLGKLDPGEERTVKVGFKGPMAGIYCHRINALADDLSAPGKLVRVKEVQKCTIIEGGAGVTWNIIPSDGDVLVGDNLSFTVLIRNQGNDDLHNIRTTVFVPKELVIKNISGPTDNKQFQNPAKLIKVEFSPLQLLPAGKEAKYIFEVTAIQPPNTPAFTIDNPGVANIEAQMIADEHKSGSPVIRQQNIIIGNIPKLLNPNANPGF